MVKIAVDAMGGDNAPQAPVEGALRAVRELGVEVLLTGRPAEIGACLAKLGHTSIWQTLLRSVFIGLAAMGSSYLVGSVLL